MDARRLVLLDHARTHSQAMQQASGDGLDMFLRGPADKRHLADRLEDAVLFGLGEEQLRIVPNAGQNSLAWLLWHMTRVEDVVMNLLVAGRGQVVNEEGWAARLGVAPSDIGAGMRDDAVSDFTQRVDLAALRAYRAAVGRRTHWTVASMSPEALEQPVDPTRLGRALAEGVLGENNTDWIKDFWADRTNAWCCSLVVGHNFLHLGEAFSVRSQAGLALGA